MMKAKRGQLWVLAPSANPTRPSFEVWAVSGTMAFGRHHPTGKTAKLQLSKAGELPGYALKYSPPKGFFTSDEGLGRLFATWHIADMIERIWGSAAIGKSITGHIRGTVATKKRR